MIILDNIIFSIQRSGGVSVVWEELLTRLLIQTKFPIRYIEHCHPDNIHRKRIEIPVNEIIRKSNLLIQIRRYLPLQIKKNEKFIFHSSYYRYCTSPNAVNITTVHDFTYEYFFHGLRKHVHFLQKKMSIQHSKYIIAISQNTKKDILKFFPDINEQRIRVIYNGVSDDYYKLSQECSSFETPFEKYSYVLFVGSRVYYKKFDLAVKAVSRSKYKFVIVGPKLASSEIVLLNENFEDQTRYKHLGYISNHELNILYNYAFTLLYPSIYEGFGIPVLESQKANCPVIAVNLSSIPEIIGNSPLLLDEVSENSILRCFEMLEDKNIRLRITAEGLKNVTRFSWNATFDKVMDLYSEILNNEQIKCNNIS